MRDVVIYAFLTGATANNTIIYALAGDAAWAVYCGLVALVGAGLTLHAMSLVEKGEE